MQDDLKSRLEEKQRVLAELRRARSDATCASKYSSGIDVERETQIEELEEEIEGLRKKLKQS
jgi:hypothetical protein